MQTPDPPRRRPVVRFWPDREGRLRKATCGGCEAVRCGPPEALVWLVYANGNLRYWPAYSEAAALKTLVSLHTSGWP
jgi:hypothetical protein